MVLISLTKPLSP